MSQKIKLYMENSDTIAEPISQNSFCKGVTKIIPVLASFDTAGNIQPAYVSINNETHKVSPLSLKRFGSLQIFKCLVENAGFDAEISITFNPCDNIWYLLEA